MRYVDFVNYIQNKFYARIASDIKQAKNNIHISTYMHICIYVLNPSIAQYINIYF